MQTPGSGSKGGQQFTGCIDCPAGYSGRKGRLDWSFQRGALVVHSEEFSVAIKGRRGSSRGGLWEAQKSVANYKLRSAYDFGRLSLNPGKIRSCSSFPSAPRTQIWLQSLTLSSAEWQTHPGHTSDPRKEAACNFFQDVFPR